MTVLSVYIKPR